MLSHSRLRAEHQVQVQVNRFVPAEVLIDFGGILRAIHRAFPGTHKAARTQVNNLAKETIWKITYGAEAPKFSVEMIGVTLEEKASFWAGDFKKENQDRRK